MIVLVSFYSYCREQTGCAQTTELLPEGSTLEDLFRALAARFSRLGPMGNSLLMAVGLDYQGRDYVLRQGDEVALFPPVQGG